MVYYPSQPRYKCSSPLDTPSHTHSRPHKAATTPSTPPTRKPDPPPPFHNLTISLYFTHLRQRYQRSPHEPPRHPILQTLPPILILRIFRYLDRRYLQIFFYGSSRRLKSAANLVLMERFAGGVARCRGVGAEGFDGEQVRRTVGLCESVRGVNVAMGRNVMKGRVVGGSDCLRRGVKVMYDAEEAKKKEEHASQAVDRLHSTNKCPIAKTHFPTSTNRFPDEIVLQILETQDYKLLRGLFSLELCQLQRVAETILFEGRREQLGSPVRRKGSSSERDKYRLWPAISELGEEYLGRRFILVNCSLNDAYVGQVDSKEDDGVGKLSLGSYWRVICYDDVDVGRAIGCS